MKLDEKTINKEKEALIIRKYQQYLKLEKALSANTLDAYLTDLDKLLRFLKAENIDMLSTCNVSPPACMTSAFIPAPRHASCPE